MYLMYVNRSRIDQLGSGLISGFRRIIVRGRVRAGLRTNLKQVAMKLDSSCGGGS
jgi:hypothetical protein